MTYIVPTRENWRTALEPHYIRFIDGSRCPECGAPCGLPCMGWRGSVMDYTHESRRQSVFAIERRAAAEKRARLAAWRLSPEYAAILEARAERHRAQAARIAEIRALSVVRLHHPPRSLSECSAFVPPPRVRDADEPVVPHPMYAPIQIRPARRRVFDHALTWPLALRLVSRDGGVLVAHECGRRIPAMRRAE